MPKYCLPCLREIEREGQVYSSALNDIDDVISKERITNQDIQNLSRKLNGCDLPLTSLGSTQLFTYMRALEDTNQPVDSVRKEIKRIREYIEPAVNAARKTLETARKRGNFKDRINF